MACSNNDTNDWSYYWISFKYIETNGHSVKRLDKTQTNDKNNITEESEENKTSQSEEIIVKKDVNGKITEAEMSVKEKIIDDETDDSVL